VEINSILSTLQGIPHRVLSGFPECAYTVSGFELIFGEILQLIQKDPLQQEIPKEDKLPRQEAEEASIYNIQPQSQVDVTQEEVELPPKTGSFEPAPRQEDSRTREETSTGPKPIIQSPLTPIKEDHKPHKKVVIEGPSGQAVYIPHQEVAEIYKPSQEAVIQDVKPDSITGKISLPEEAQRLIPEIGEAMVTRTGFEGIPDVAWKDSEEFVLPMVQKKIDVEGQKSDASGGDQKVFITYEISPLKGLKPDPLPKSISISQGPSEWHIKEAPKVDVENGVFIPPKAKDPGELKEVNALPSDTRGFHVKRPGYIVLEEFSTSEEGMNPREGSLGRYTAAPVELSVYVAQGNYRVEHPEGAGSVEVLRSAELRGVSRSEDTPRIMREGVRSNAFQRAEFIQRVLKAAKVAQLQGRAMVKMVLNPPTLGGLKIQLVMKGKVLQGNFEVASGYVRELILSSFDELREALQQQGISPGRFDVFTRSSGEGGPGEDLGEEGIFEQARVPEEVIETLPQGGPSEAGLVNILA
jgi:hypothetical protein